MAGISISQLRAQLADAINRVAFGKERLILERQGKRLAALVPMEDLEALEALEDKLLVAASDEAMQEPGDDVPWEQVKAAAGLG